MKVPPDLAHAIGLDAWPDAVEARATLTRGTRGTVRVALLTWAHAVAGAPPTSRAWAAVLGVTPAALRSMRHELALALPVAEVRREPRDPSTLAPSSVRRRRAEARARGEDVPKQRPGRKPTKPAKPRRAKKRRRETSQRERAHSSSRRGAVSAPQKENRTP